MPETLTQTPHTRRVVETYDPEQISLDVDYVYHLTSTDRINVDHLVLQPNSERGKLENWRKLEQFIDDQRPEHIRQLGISRRGAIFANPTIDPISDRYSFGARPRSDNEDTDHRIAVELEVDPSKVVVCDATLLSQQIVERADLGSASLEQAKRMARSYWDNAISLDDFRKLYDTTFYHGAEAVLKKGVPEEGRRRTYLEPEVLVPGPIESDHLRVAASGIKRQMHAYI